MGLFTVKRIVIPDLEEKAKRGYHVNGFTQEEDQVIASYYGRVSRKAISEHLKKMGHHRSIDSIRGRHRALQRRGVKVE